MPAMSPAMPRPVPPLLLAQLKVPALSNLAKKDPPPGQVEGPRARVEIRRAREFSRCVDVACAVHRDAAAFVVVRRSAHSLGPYEVAVSRKRTWPPHQKHGKDSTQDHHHDPIHPVCQHACFLHVCLPFSLNRLLLAALRRSHLVISSGAFRPWFSCLQHHHDTVAAFVLAGLTFSCVRQTARPAPVRWLTCPDPSARQRACPHPPSAPPPGTKWLHRRCRR